MAIDMQYNNKYNFIKEVHGYEGVKNRTSDFESRMCLLLWENY